MIGGLGKGAGNRGQSSDVVSTSDLPAAVHMMGGRGSVARRDSGLPLAMLCLGAGKGGPGVGKGGLVAGGGFGGKTGVGPVGERPSGKVPICAFGAECRMPQCMLAHPPGRQAAPKGSPGVGCGMTGTGGLWQGSRESTAGMGVDCGFGFECGGRFGFCANFCSAFVFGEDVEWGVVDNLGRVL